MKKYFFLLLLIPMVGLAQQKEAAYRPLILKWNITSLADALTFPTLQLGAEKRLNNRFSIAADVGTQLYSLGEHQTDTSFTGEGGFKVNLGFRYYLKPFKKSVKSKYARRKRTEPYLELNPFYMHNTYNETTRYTQRVTGSYDCFAVHKNIYGANIIFGLQFRTKGRMVVDLYGGVGIRYRNVKNKYREYDPLLYNSYNQMGFAPTIDPLETSLEENNGIKPSVKAGLRVCIITGKIEKK